MNTGRHHESALTVDDPLTRLQSLGALFFLGDEGVDERFSPLQFSSGDRERRPSQIRLEIFDVARESFQRLRDFRRKTHVGR